MTGSIRRVRSASAADIAHFIFRTTLAIGAAALLAGCMARPVGDFGRAAPSFTHDTAMPFVGDALANARGEPVSNFNKTDQENEMHNRVWRFLVAAHSKDWFYDTVVEWQRTRIIPEHDTSFSVDRYYLWLTRTHYESSRTRYATVGRHVAADLDTLPTTFRSICAVMEIDRQRAIALHELRNLGPDVSENVAARKAENDMHIAWFARALTYRYKSYSYALDHLLVETPHEQSMAVDEALRRLSLWVDKANRWDFCFDQGSFHAERHDVAIPSRYAHPVFVEEDDGLPRK